MGRVGGGGANAASGANAVANASGVTATAASSGGPFVLRSVRIRCRDASTRTIDFYRAIGLEVEWQAADMQQPSKQQQQQQAVVDGTIESSPPSVFAMSCKAETGEVPSALLVFECPAEGSADYLYESTRPDQHDGAGPSTSTGRAQPRKSFASRFADPALAAELQRFEVTRTAGTAAIAAGGRITAGTALSRAAKGPGEYLLFYVRQLSRVCRRLAARGELATRAMIGS
ncbi:hypothetical protein HK405_010550 [Cladochytrium tenue]|nr:hypothetical protein HK405_010550 [Cladochytrium tenue]